MGLAMALESSGHGIPLTPNKLCMGFFNVQFQKYWAGSCTTRLCYTLSFVLTYTISSFTCLESFLLDVAEVFPVRDDGLPEPGLRGLSDLGGILGNVGVLWLLANPFVAGLAFILVLIALPAPFLTPLVFRPADRWSPLVIRWCHGIQTVWVQSKPLDSAGF